MTTERVLKASRMLADPAVGQWVQRGERRTQALVRLVYAVQDEVAELSDDEIANWTMPDVVGGLEAAQWALIGQFPKSCGVELRTAFDVGMLSLYFHVRELEHPQPGGWNTIFSEWDSGVRRAANWGEIKQYLEGRRRYSRYRNETGIDALGTAYALFQELSAYTHTRAYSESGEVISMFFGQGAEDPGIRERFEKLEENVVDLLARCWLAVFPEVSRVSSDCLSTLLVSPDSLRTLAWARATAHC